MRQIRTALDFDDLLEENLNRCLEAKKDPQTQVMVKNVNAILGLKLAKEKAAVQVESLRGQKPSLYFFDPVRSIGDASEIQQPQKKIGHNG